jgi:glycosyltransferase involved in cell wall biosynthesis
MVLEQLMPVTVDACELTDATASGVRSTALRVAIVQPNLTQYRMPVFLELSRHCRVDLLFSPAKSELGFGEVKRPQTANVRFFEVTTVKPFGEKFGMMQLGIAKYLFRERPEAVIIFANPRYFSFWTTLLLGRLLGIKVFAHGHGLYKWERINFFYRLMVKVMLRLVTSYIAYAPYVRRSFVMHGFSIDKVSVAPNSLQLSATVRPEEKSGRERGILFVGRLRKDSNLELLLEAVARLRQESGLPLTIEIAGSGECATQLHRQYGAEPWIHWYGEVYDPERIREISLQCFAGCYPGDAGLSVLHMMALSLPVVTHNQLARHKGPEPSFIEDGVSGILYDRTSSQESLLKALRSLAADASRRCEMQRAAFARYRELVDPSLATHLWGIIGKTS